MRKIIAIGGSTAPFLSEILQITAAKTPTALVIPTARYDYDSDEMPRRLIESRYEVDSLYLLKAVPDRSAIADRILNSDIIFVEGGNTINMLRIWRKLGVDEALRQAHQSGRVLAGVSAGATCWFTKAISGPLPSKVLFGVPLTFQRELNSGGNPWRPDDSGGEVSRRLREVFVRNGILLSEDAAIYWTYGFWGSRKGRMWQIVDRGNRQQHYIRKKNGKLYVCKNERFMQSRGLGLIPGNLCCHYEQRREGLKELMRKTGGVAIGMEDQCAIVVIDDAYRLVSADGARAYRVYWKRGKFHEEIIEQKEELTPMSSLLRT